MIDLDSLTFEKVGLERFITIGGLDYDDPIPPSTNFYEITHTLHFPNFSALVDSIKDAPSFRQVSFKNRGEPRTRIRKTEKELRDLDYRIFNDVRLTVAYSNGSRTITDYLNFVKANDEVMLLRMNFSSLKAKALFPESSGRKFICQYNYIYKH